jgi:hypothetical protein
MRLLKPFDLLLQRNVVGPGISRYRVTFSCIGYDPFGEVVDHGNQRGSSQVKVAARRTHISAYSFMNGSGKRVMLPKEHHWFLVASDTAAVLTGLGVGR